MNVNWKVVLLFNVYFPSPTFCRSHGKKRGFGFSLLEQTFSKLGLASKCCTREGAAARHGTKAGQVGRSLRSVSLAIIRPASISRACLILTVSTSCLSRTHIIPPNPTMMDAWLGKAKEGASGTGIRSPAAFAT